MAVYKKGAKGSAIKKLQVKMNKLGIKPKLNVNSVFDDKMLDAVKAFQKKSKLKVDGVLGPNTQAAIDSRGKAPKWTVKDVKRPIKVLKGKASDVYKSWLELATLMVESSGHKDLKFAYRNFKIMVDTYRDFLDNFVAELERVEELRVEFTSKLSKKPAEQAVAHDEAVRAFQKAMKMNKIAEKLRRKFDYEHDSFLKKLDEVGG